MKTYLITGGAGFIGSNFIIYMMRKHSDIHIINLDKLTYAGNLENLSEIANDPRYEFIHGDITNSETVGMLFTKYPIDVVVHFAAESHVDRSILDPGVFAHTNVIGTLTLLNAALAHWNDHHGGFRPGVKFMHVSTDEVYGSLDDTGYFTETTPINPHSPYSASKAASDLFVLSFFDTYGLPVNITRCSNNYGPYQFPEKLIPLMIHNALNHKSLPVYGKGLNIRDWLFVDDHCKAIDMVIDGGKSGEVYNVGGHNERSNITIVQTIVDYIHKHVDSHVNESLISYVEDRKGHDWRYAIDPGKIWHELGWKPEIPFEEGIQLTIQWYLANNAWLNNIINGEYLKYYELIYRNR
jgi:dTDP-glucose 4,6-dehydratase